MHGAGDQRYQRLYGRRQRGHAPLQRRGDYRPIQTDDEIVEAQRRPHPCLREHGRERAAHRPDEAVVARDSLDVERRGTAGSEVRTNKREELARDQVERDVRLPVRVDDDEIVVL